MVQITNRNQDVAVFYPSDSLLLRMVEWLRGTDSFSLRLVTSPQPACIQHVLGATTIAVVDATGQAANATAALEQCIAAIGPEKTAIYTELMHEGLEVFARTRKVQLLLGPLNSWEWSGFTEWLEREETVPHWSQSA